jgi:hypothetical protein
MKRTSQAYHARRRRDSPICDDGGAGIARDGRLVRTTCGQAARVRVAQDDTTTVTKEIRGRD